MFKLCDYLGEKTGELIPAKTTNGKLFVYKCNHPEHITTTLTDCFNCPHTTVKKEDCGPCKAFEDSKRGS